jgi:hypothetical protein
LFQPSAFTPGENARAAKLKHKIVATTLIRFIFLLLKLLN